MIGEVGFNALEIGGCSEPKSASSLKEETLKTLTSFPMGTKYYADFESYEKGNK